MPGHDLKVGIIVDLDIGGSNSPGSLEIYGGVYADVGEEAALIPRCLPLGFIVSERDRQN